MKLNELKTPFHQAKKKWKRNWSVKEKQEAEV